MTQNKKKEVGGRVGGVGIRSIGRTSEREGEAGSGRQKGKIKIAIHFIRTYVHSRHGLVVVVGAAFVSLKSRVTHSSPWCAALI